MNRTSALLSFFAVAVFVAIGVKSELTQNEVSIAERTTEPLGASLLELCEAEFGNEIFGTPSSVRSTFNP